MGRIRTIKPEFWIHEELSSLSAETHMLAAGLLNYADDFGFFNPHPALIKAAVFPLRETFSPVPVMVEQLVSIGYIRIGTMKDGKKVGEVCNFLSHQRVSHPTKSRYSDSEIEWEPSRKIPEDSRKAPETFRPERKGKEGKGKEQGKENTSLRQAQSDPRHVPFKLACETYAKYKGVTFVWDGGEAKQLAAILAASPELTLGVFQQCLQHRAKSQVPHGERPREWLGTILKYQEGPLDQYGKPQGAGNGTFKGKSGQSVDAAKRAIQEIEDSYALDRAGNSETGEVGCGGLPALRLGS